MATIRTTASAGMDTTSTMGYYRAGMYEMLKHVSIHGHGKKGRKGRKASIHGHNEKRHPDIYHNKGRAKGQH